MIDRLRVFSEKVYRGRPFAVALAVISTALVGVAIFASPQSNFGEQYLIPGVVFTLWMLLICSFLYTFPYVPEKLDKSAGLFKRFVVFIKRGYFYLLALSITVVTLGVIFLSYRLISIWAGWV